MILDHQIWNIISFIIFKKILQNQFNQLNRFMFRVLFFFHVRNARFQFLCSEFFDFFWTFNSLDSSTNPDFFGRRRSFAVAVLLSSPFCSICVNMRFVVKRSSSYASILNIMQMNSFLFTISVIVSFLTIFLLLSKIRKSTISNL